MSLFTPGLFTTVAILVLVIFFLSAALRILKEYERGVIFRLGRIINAKGPGLIILIPIIDKMLKVSLRLVAMDVDPQDVITSVKTRSVHRPCCRQSEERNQILRFQKLPLHNPAYRTT